MLFAKVGPILRSAKAGASISDAVCTEILCGTALVHFGNGIGETKKFQCILTLEIVWELHDSEIQKQNICYLEIIKGPSNKPLLYLG